MLDNLFPTTFCYLLPVALTGMLQSIRCVSVCLCVCLCVSVCMFAQSFQNYDDLAIAEGPRDAVLS